MQDGRAGFCLTNVSGPGVDCRPGRGRLLTRLDSSRVRAHDGSMIDTRTITTCSYFWAYL
jgi:hypothetical protein